MRSLRIIFVLAGKHLRILSRMRAILLVLMLPGVVLYTVFTLIFSGPAGRPFKVGIVDMDDSEASRKLIETLQLNNVVVISHEHENPRAPLLTESSVRKAIRQEGRIRVAVIIPKGYGQTPANILPTDRAAVDLIYDETQPEEAEIVTGLLQMAAGRALLDRFAPKLAASLSTQPTEASTQHEHHDLLIKVNRKGLASEHLAIAPEHTFLAGIVPMFLLFAGASSARGLLEQLTSGEMRRILAAPISPWHILLGQMLAAMVLSIVQCYIMYIYAWLVFKVAIWSIAGGLLVLTLATCLATTACGMLLASICRTSEQLDGIGTMAIIAMSAIGGSMVPRFIMPFFMQRLGLFTINGWSYDGFIALIFNEGWAGIRTPCLVLVSIAVGAAIIGSMILTRRLKTEPLMS